jgi:hypothetical protein
LVSGNNGLEVQVPKDFSVLFTPRDFVAVQKSRSSSPPSYVEFYEENAWVHEPRKILELAIRTTIGIQVVTYEIGKDWDDSAANVFKE